jgi:hypothetical protein
MRGRILTLIVACVAIGAGIYLISRDDAALMGDLAPDNDSSPVSQPADIPPDTLPGTVVEAPPKAPPNPLARLPSGISPPPPTSPAGRPEMAHATPTPNVAFPPPAASLAVAPAIGSSPVVAPAISVPPPGKGKASKVSSEEVAADVDKINLSLRDYRTVMGENPVGTNAEITKALNGGNPKQARLLPEGTSVNGNGELVDRWGKPYFFHQMSKTHMEIRSAGPDGQMWTDDDTVSN